MMKLGVRRGTSRFVIGGDMPGEIQIKIDRLLIEFGDIIEIISQKKELGKSIVRSLSPCNIVALLDAQNLYVLAQRSFGEPGTLYIYKPDIQESQEQALDITKGESGFTDSFFIIFPAYLLEKQKEERRASLEAIASTHIDSERLIFEKATKEEMKEKEKKMPYDTLQRLENSLREFISKELSKVTPDWWIQRVPHDVRQHAEDRKAKNESLWPWHHEKDLPLIYYIDFPDYIKIITRKDNWKDVFAPIFRDNEAISTKLRELEPIRNDIAHSREISAQAGKKLEIYAKEIIGATQKSK